MDHNESGGALEWKILDCSIDGEKEKGRIEKDIAPTAGRNEAAGKRECLR